MDGNITVKMDLTKLMNLLSHTAVPQGIIELLMRIDNESREHCLSLVHVYVLGTLHGRIQSMGGVVHVADS